MTLLVANQSSSDVVLVGLPEAVVIPASSTPPANGAVVNVTSKLQDLTGSQYASLETQRSSVPLHYFWTSEAEYSTGILKVSSSALVFGVAEVSMITQTAIGDTVMGAMTLTPIAGTYLVLFTGDIQISASNHPAYADIWVGGVQIPSSTQSFNATNADDLSDPPPECVVKAAMGNFCCQTIATVNGNQAIEGRWRTTQGSTATNNRRAISALITRVG